MKYTDYDAVTDSDIADGRDTISTQYQTMATIPISLTHYAVSGAEE